MWSRRGSEPEPVRPDQVARLAPLVESLHDAMLCDEGPEGEADYRRAEAMFEAARRNSTSAEVEAAYRANRG